MLAICRYVFETPIGWDDGFAEAGGHSIVIARLARRLQAAGWAVSVRALLSDCNTARKVASRTRQVQAPIAAATVAAKSAQTSAVRDESAAKVLSVGRFTILQILFATLLYSPGLLASLDVLSAVEIGTFFATASIWTFIVAGVGLYLLSLLLPFASLLWVMTHQVLHGRRHLPQQRDAGRLPEVEQDAPAGLVHRTNGEPGARCPCAPSTAARR